MSKITKSIWTTPKEFAVMGLVTIYLRLARHEERLAKCEFGQAYLDYLQRTPVWIPTFFPTTAGPKTYLT